MAESVKMRGWRWKFEIDWRKWGKRVLVALIFVPFYFSTKCFWMMLLLSNSFISTKAYSFTTFLSNLVTQKAEWR